MVAACTECRAAKVKCNKSNDPKGPCARCQRLGTACIPHASRQGQRKRPRPENNATLPEQQREDAAIAARLRHIISKDHYGLQSLVRQWIALAFKRRTFALLDMAAKLALQCGMSMDDVLCEQEGNSEVAPRRGMDCLYSSLLVPAAQQVVVGPQPLRARDIPASLWRSIGIRIIDQEKDDTRQTQSKQSQSADNTALETALNERWIFVRETRRGVSRFYVSPGWERHVGVTVAAIADVYTRNDVP